MLSRLNVDVEYYYLYKYCLLNRNIMRFFHSFTVLDILYNSYLQVFIITNCSLAIILNVSDYKVTIILPFNTVASHHE